GLRIFPLRFVDRGLPREDVINLILTNVRLRANQHGDMNAPLGALRLGERRLLALLERFGVVTAKAAVEQLLDLAQRHMRDMIARVPDGAYRFSLIVEDPGRVVEDPRSRWRRPDTARRRDRGGRQARYQSDASSQLGYPTNRSQRRGGCRGSRGSAG